VRILTTLAEETRDYRNSVRKMQIQTLGSTASGSIYYDYDLPESTAEAYNLHDGSEQSTVTEYTYDGSAAFHNRGKPVSITVTNNYHNKPSVYSTTEYEYNGTSGLVE